MIVRSGCNEDSECLQSVAQAAGVDSSAVAFQRDLDDPAITLFVAENDSAAVGFIALRSAPSPAFIPSRSPLQLWRLYIHPKFHGKGVARSLTGRALIHAHGRDHDVLWLGTEAANARAIAFYGKCGFVVAGTENLHGDSASLNVVMTCWL
jgi:ribosomal protein S18 acetylase RimI-like enzyme